MLEGLITPEKIMEQWDFWYTHPKEFRMLVDGGQHVFDWVAISGKKLTEEFMDEFHDKLDWSVIITTQELSQEFVTKHLAEILCQVCKHLREQQQTLTNIMKTQMQLQYTSSDVPGIINWKPSKQWQDTSRTWVTYSNNPSELGITI